MAYLRGANYIWSDGEGFHFWNAYGADGWEHTGWHEAVTQNPGPPPVNAGSGPGGVWVPADATDQFVLMRFAEILEEGRFFEIVQKVIDSYTDEGEVYPRGRMALRLKSLIDRLPEI